MSQASSEDGAPPAKRRRERTRTPSLHSADGDRPPRPARPTDDGMREMVSCGICYELVFQPLTLGCLHTYCGDEIVSWMQDNDSCPTCRTRIISIREAYPTSALLDHFLQLHPEETREMTDAEKDEKRQIYKPGDDLKKLLRDANARGGRGMMFYDLGDEDEDEDEDDYDDHYEDHADPCRFCDPNNTLGFVCPVPCPPEVITNGIDLARNPNPPGHQPCYHDRRLIPRRPDAGDTCLRCRGIFCASGTECNDGAFIGAAKDFPGPAPTRYDQQQYGAADFESFLRMLAGATPGLNGHETGIMTGYYQDKHVSLDDVWLEMLGRADIPVSFARADGQEHQLTDDDVICRSCSLIVFKTHLARWWIVKYPEVKDDLPNNAGNRAKCWYGRECRTQWHNMQHAQRLCHASDPVPQDQRTNTVPRRPAPAPPAAAAPATADGEDDDA